MANGKIKKIKDIKDRQAQVAKDYKDALKKAIGKDAKDLTLPQVAFVVSLINKPALPDRSFATDPALRGREQIQDANWAETARGTTRVLELMQDEGVIDDEDLKLVNYAETPEEAWTIIANFHGLM